MKRQKVGDIYERVKDTEDIVRMSNLGLARVLEGEGEDEVSNYLKS